MIAALSVVPILKVAIALKYKMDETNKLEKFHQYALK
jgi:hypothetical protein